MKYLLILLLFALSGILHGAQVVAVSAGGKLTVFRVDGEKLTEVQSIDLNGRSGPMGLSPDRKLLYVNTAIPADDGAKAKSAPAFATFRVGEDGTLTHIHTAASGWNSGYLRADASGKFLAGNHYGLGKVGIWSLDKDGVFRGAPPIDFELEKRAHSAVFSPDNRFLFVPATGPNKVFQLVFNSEKGTVHPNQPSSAPGPKGEDEARQPRHLIFHPNGKFAYTTNERLLPGAGAWTYDAKKGLLESIQGLPSLDGNTDPDGMTTADLHFSIDQRFLFVSNRDIKNRNAPEGRDSIAVFKLDSETGKLSFVKQFPCERVPRSFATGLEGKLLFVSGQGDLKLGVHRIDQASGHLTRVASYDLPGKPSWVSVIPTSR